MGSIFYSVGDKFFTFVLKVNIQVNSVKLKTPLISLLVSSRSVTFVLNVTLHLLTGKKVPHYFLI